MALASCTHLVNRLGVLSHHVQELVDVGPLAGRVRSASGPLVRMRGGRSHLAQVAHVAGHVLDRLDEQTLLLRRADALRQQRHLVHHPAQLVQLAIDVVRVISAAETAAAAANRLAQPQFVTYRLELAVDDRLGEFVALLASLHLRTDCTGDRPPRH